MREGWKTKPLCDLCTFSRGLTYKKSDETGVSENVVLRASNIDLETNLLDFSDLRYIRTPIPAAKLVKAGSLLICTASGSKSHLGKVAFIDQDYGFGFGGFMGMITPGAELDPRYLFFLMISERFRDFISELSDGLNINNLKYEYVGRFQIPVPPLPEQRRTVAILDEAFEAIAKARANTEKNLQNARDLFESHLNAVFSQRGEGWDVHTLRDLLSEQPRNGWSPPAKYQTGSGVPVLTLSAVTGFQYDGSRVKLSSAPTREDAHYWLRPGELLITRSNTAELVGHVAIYDGTPARTICCDLIMKMTVDPSKAVNRYIYYSLRTSGARTYLTSNAKGASSTMKKICKAIVQNLPVPVPSISRQAEIVEALDLLWEKSVGLAASLERKLTALDELKKSLLHQAFTGQLTEKVVEDSLEAEGSLPAHS